MSNVDGSAEKASTRKPTSMSALPLMVKSTNFIAEYSLRPDPQIEIRKYIGISSTSQKRKKRIRSCAVKTPSTPVSNASSQAKYSLDRSSMFHEMSMATTNRNVVRITIVSDRPSTPRKY